MSSPNMNLPIPIPSQTGGPQYANDEVSCFKIIDSHNHTAGQGVQIPLDALSVTQSLDMNSHSIINAKSLGLLNQNVSPGSGSVYMVNNDLYWTDGTGAFNVQITSGNAVNVPGSAGFAGLPSGTASAAFISGTGTFRFRSATNTAATLDVGPVITRNTTVSSNGITITPPNPLASDYTITLPASTPPSTKILQMTSTGDVTNSLGVDNSTLEISANTLQVKNLGIGTNQLADGSVTLQKLNLVGSTYSEDLINTGSGTATSTSPLTIMTNTVTTTQANQNLLINCWSTGGGPLVTAGGLWSYYGGLSGDQGIGPYSDPSCGLMIFINGPGVVNYNVLSIAPNRQGSGAVYICYGHGSAAYLAVQAGVYTITAKVVTVFGGGGSAVTYYQLSMATKIVL